MIPMKDIKRICEKMNFGIELRVPNDNGHARVNYINKTDNMIKMNLIENHYFLQEETTITGCAFKNYESIKHLDDWNLINEIQTVNEKMYYRRRPNNFIDSFKLVLGYKLTASNKSPSCPLRLYILLSLLITLPPFTVFWINIRGIPDILYTPS